MTTSKVLGYHGVGRVSGNKKESLHVLLASASSGSQGGGELYMAGLAKQLVAEGHQIDLVLSDHPRMDGLADMIGAEIRVHRIPYVNSYDRKLRVFGAVFSRRTVATMTKVFQTIRPDIIHINKQNVEDGLDLILAARRSGFPHVSTIHITHSMQSLNAVAGRLRDALTRRQLRTTGSHYLTTADAGRVELSKYLQSQEHAATIHLVRNGVAPAPTADRAAIRQEWNCGPRDIVLGCVARIERQKNPLFLVELLSRMPENVRVIWVGDGRMRGELESAASRYGVSNRLRIEGWRSDARVRMAGFDVFVLPSEYEGFPFAALEAMAAGLPCVVSDADGIREAIIDGENGRLLPPSDMVAWVAAIEQAVADPPLRARWGAAALRRYQQHFSLEAMACGTAAVYRKVIAQFRSR
ncbi:MAG TPA: glycosyltransferase family 4 protein [Pirellulales bacterium]|nr:glycosyltransferase family 4 protein [Pirellulales bacterium]